MLEGLGDSLVGVWFVLIWDFKIGFGRISLDSMLVTILKLVLLTSMLVLGLAESMPRTVLVIMAMVVMVVVVLWSKVR